MFKEFVEGKNTKFSKQKDFAEEYKEVQNTT